MSGLYKTDYKVINEEDKEQDEKLKKQYTEIIGINAEYRWKRPKSMRHYDSLFPNNYLDINGKTKQRLNEIEKINNEYLNFIKNPSATELDLARFIKEKEAYFIIASILGAGFNFGHHDAYLFPEFKLGDDYRVDYLIIGKNSDGFHFIFVEMEAINGNTIIKSGDMGESTRNGYNQLQKWKRWLESNFSTINFSKFTKEGTALSNEFHKYSESRIHFVEVVGRRENFNNEFRNIIRDKKRNENVLILHYDNLYDLTKRIYEKPSCNDCE